MKTIQYPIDNSLKEVQSLSSNVLKVLTILTRMEMLQLCKNNAGAVLASLRFWTRSRLKKKAYHIKNIQIMHIRNLKMNLRNEYCSNKSFQTSLTKNSCWSPMALSSGPNNHAWHLNFIWLHKTKANKINGLDKQN